MIHLRQQIDLIDRQLKQLLKKRARLVFEIQRFKAEHQLPLRDPGREQEILADMESDLSPQEIRYLTEVYEAIFNAADK